MNQGQRDVARRANSDPDGQLDVRREQQERWTQGCQDEEAPVVASDAVQRLCCWLKNCKELGAHQCWMSTDRPAQPTAISSTSGWILIDDVLAELQAADPGASVSLAVADDPQGVEPLTDCELEWVLGRAELGGA